MGFQCFSRKMLYERRSFVKSGVSWAKILVFSVRRMADEVKIPVEPFALHLLDKGPATESTVKKKDALSYYRDMVTIREQENNTKQLYTRKLIHGFCHMYAGQEACGVGIYACLRPDDVVITSYRLHGWAYLLSGGNLVGYFGEMFGKACGLSKGKGGSMHMYSGQLYGGFAIVASQVPVGAGIAFALKYLGKKNVCFTLFGEGAANQGQVYEAFNMAKLWNVPCVFICENNKYAMGTALHRGAAHLTVYDRVNYLPGVLVNGMSVLAVKEGIKFAMDYCDSGKGPIILELETYRYTGHSVSDPDTTYRTREEIQEVRSKSDCIDSFKKQIVKSGLVTEDELKKIKKARHKFVAESIEKALKDQPLPPNELCSNTYVKYEPEVRGTVLWKPFPHKDATEVKNK